MRQGTCCSERDIRCAGSWRSASTGRIFSTSSRGWRYSRQRKRLACAQESPRGRRRFSFHQIPAQGEFCLCGTVFATGGGEVVGGAVTGGVAPPVAGSQVL